MALDLLQCLLGQRNTFPGAVIVMPGERGFGAVHGGVDVAFHGIAQVRIGDFGVPDFAQVNLAQAVVIVGRRREGQGECSQEQAGEQGVFHVVFRRK